VCDIHPLVLYFAMYSGDFFYLASAAVRISLLRGEASLGVSQLLTCEGTKKIALDQFSVTGGDKVHNSEVDADFSSCRDKLLRGHVDAAHVHPPLGAFALYGDGLWDAFKRPVAVHLDLTNAKQPKTPLFGYEFPARAIFPLKGIEALRRPKARKARSLTVLSSTKEGNEGPIETLQRSSTEGDPTRHDIGADLDQPSERFALVNVGDRPSLPQPCTNSLFKSRVV
jgi:hypothetical protein